MNFEIMMGNIKLGRVARRDGWEGHVRVEGIRMIRVRPNKLPAEYCATIADREAIDWVVSGNIGRPQ